MGYGISLEWFTLKVANRNESQNSWKQLQFEEFHRRKAVVLGEIMDEAKQEDVPDAGGTEESQIFDNGGGGGGVSGTFFALFLNFCDFIDFFLLFRGAWKDFKVS